MNILVTGGAGFIGSALVKRLLKMENNNVFNIDKLNYASNIEALNKDILKIKNNKYQLLKFDLIDAKKIDKSFEISEPDIVFHLAAESHVDRSIKSPDIFIYSNIIGTYNLLKSAKKYWDKLSKKRQESFRFIHISTDEVFGSLGLADKFSEESAYAPRSPYSSSKASSDLIVKSWFHTYKLPIIITNSCNNYGPRQYPEKLIPLAIEKALNGDPIPIYGNGKNIREWIYIDDHVEALIKVSNLGKVGESYCIGSGIELTNLEMIKKICLLLNKIQKNKNDYQRLIRFVKDREGHDFRYSLDSSKFRKLTGWECNYNLDEGLEKTIDWHINQKLGNLNIQKDIPK